MSQAEPATTNPSLTSARNVEATDSPTNTTGAGRIHRAWETTRDLLNIVGYVLAACLIVYALFRPDSVKSYLHTLGLHEVKAGGVELGFDVTATADSLSQLSLRVDDLEKHLQDASASVENPQAKAKIASVTQQAVVLRQDIGKADESLRDAVAKQTEQIQSAHSDNVVGWIFLGRTDESITRWEQSDSVPMPIDSRTGPKFSPGDRLTLKNSAYLRGDGEEYAITKHPIIGAISANATVRILELRPNNIRSGGKYLWAKVEYER